MEKFLPCYEKAFCEKTEKSITAEMILQEYLPNAVKIVKVSATPTVDECEVQKDAVCVRGHVKFSAIYLSDFKDKLKCAVYTENFTHTFPAAGIGEATASDGFTEWNISVSDEKGQILSQRKLSLSCKLLISAEASVMKKNTILGTDKEDNIRKLSKSVDTLEILKIRDCEMTVEDKIPLEEGMPKIREIVETECTVCSVGAQASDGSIKYHGEICFSCLYLGEAQENGEQYITFSKKLPFSGTMPDDGVTDGSYILCKGYITDVFADPVQDNYGEMGICGISVGILICSKAYSVKASEILCDAFSTKHECECEVRDTGYDAFVCGISENINISESIRANLGSITDIVSKDLSVNVISAELTGKSPVFSMRAYLALCGTNETGALETVNTSFNFKTSVSSELCELPEKCRFDTSVHVDDCSCRIENGEIKCDMSLSVCCAVYSRRTARALTAMTIDESFETVRDRSEYIIYYPDERDTVWSTAKKYRVSPEALLAVNGMNMTDTELTGKKAVIIPRTAE